MAQRRLTDRQILDHLFDDEDEQSDVSHDEGEDEVDSIHPEDDESNCDMMDEAEADSDLVSDPGAVDCVDSDYAESDDTWLIPQHEQQELDGMPSSPQSPPMPPDHPPSPMTLDEGLSVVTPPESLVVTPEPHIDIAATMDPTPLSMPPDHPPSPRTPTILVPSEGLSVVTPPETRGRRCGRSAVSPSTPVDAGPKEQLLAFRGRCIFRMYIPSKIWHQAAYDL